MTAWLDPADPERRYIARVVFSGRRADQVGKPGPGDTFSKEEAVEVVGGSGPVSVTTKVRGINPGAWNVTARLVGKGNPRMVKHEPSSGETPRGGLPWPWRYRSMSTAPVGPIQTSLIPFARVPGVIPASYSVLVALAMIVGLTVQGALLAAEGLAVRGPISVSLAAVAAGVFGAKLWYVVGHRGRRFNGWCIQGFVLFAGSVAAIGAERRLSIPVGVYLDSMVPGLLIGMGIGRIGCFFAGCCSGRPTSSRWGVWSSDRKMGAKRIPTPLMESLLSFVVAAVTTALVLLTNPAKPGAVFLGGVAAYTLGRQFVLPLRARPLYTRLGRPVTIAVAATLLVTAVVVSALS